MWDFDAKNPNYINRFTYFTSILGQIFIHNEYKLT